MPSELDPRRPPPRLRPGAAAAGAAVAAEMAEVHGLVVVGGARSCGSAWSRPRAAARAAPASRPRPRSRSTSGAVAAQVGHQRVVGVQHELRVRRRGPRAAPTVGERLQLAVAVELVAEQVGEQTGAGGQRAATWRQPRLVDLEEPDLVGSRPASSSAVATPQCMFEPARLCTTRAGRALEDRGEHGGGGGLAVGGRHEHRAVVEPRRPASGMAPGRAAAAGGRAAWCRRARPELRLSGRAAARRERDLAGGASASAGTTTRRQRGSTVIVAGRSATGRRRRRRRTGGPRPPRRAARASRAPRASPGACP